MLHYSVRYYKLLTELSITQPNRQSSTVAVIKRQGRLILQFLKKRRVYGIYDRKPFHCLVCYRNKLIPSSDTMNGANKA